MKHTRFIKKGKKRKQLEVEIKEEQKQRQNTKTCKRFMNQPKKNITDIKQKS